MLDDDNPAQNKEGVAIWLTGMSGAGKTTLGIRLKSEIERRKQRVEMLDGDIVRGLFKEELGFSHKDRINNLERVIFVTELLVKHGVVVICSFITPYKSIRAQARHKIDGYVEVYVKCPLQVLVQRDPKGLYKDALAGEIEHFTGISDPYEEPCAPEVCVETDKESEEESFSKIMAWLESHGYTAPDILESTLLKSRE